MDVCVQAVIARPKRSTIQKKLGVFAEFERAMIRERVKSGLQRAKAQGKRLDASRRGGVDRLGRPQTHLRIAARRGAQKPGLVDMVSPIFLAPASVFTEAGGV